MVSTLLNNFLTDKKIKRWRPNSEDIARPPISQFSNS
jgi:hypothetical protein